MKKRAAMLVLVAVLAGDAWAGARPAIYGPFALGMPRATALALAGPGAIAGELCGGSDGVMLERGTASLMADLTGGNVRAIEAVRASPAGTSLAQCRAEFELQLSAATSRWGAALGAPADSEIGLATMRSAQLASGSARLSLVSRWFPGGNCDTTLRLAAGEISNF